MAKHLDLEEQEQLAELKHFWKTYGDLITWVLIAVFGAYAAWNGYHYWQRSQATKAAALYDELSRAASEGDVDRLQRALTDMQASYGSTTYAKDASLVSAKVLFDKGKIDAAKAALSWVADQDSDEGLAATARLRLAAVLADQKAYDEALKQLDRNFPAPYQAMAADRKGDIHVLKGAPDAAVAEYRKAYALMDPAEGYRRVIEVKLASLGAEAQPAASGAQGAASGSEK